MHYFHYLDRSLSQKCSLVLFFGSFILFFCKQPSVDISIHSALPSQLARK